MEKSQRKGPKRKSDFRNSPGFYEEVTILKAQELISGLIKSTGISKTELASRMGQTKAHVTELLSEDRNLTLRTFGRVCYHLGAELVFDVQPIGHIQWAPEVYNTNFVPLGHESLIGSVWEIHNAVVSSSNNPWGEQLSEEEKPQIKTIDDGLAA